MANLENLNAHFITKGESKDQRIKLLVESAERQYKTLLNQEQTALLLAPTKSLPVSETEKESKQ